MWVYYAAIPVLLQDDDPFQERMDCPNCKGENLVWNVFSEAWHLTGKSTHPQPVAVLSCPDCSETIMERGVGENK